MNFFFYFTHLKRSVIIILMENPYYSYYYVNFSQNQGINICPSALIYFEKS